MTTALTVIAVHPDSRQQFFSPTDVFSASEALHETQGRPFARKPADDVFPAIAAHVPPSFGIGRQRVNRFSQRVTVLRFDKHPSTRFFDDFASLSVNRHDHWLLANIYSEAWWELPS